MKPPRSFASDNYAGIHPAFLAAIAEANQGHVPAYGGDVYTARAEKHFKRVFGDDISVGFVFNGTGANVIGLSSVLNSYNAVICSDTAHIHEDECGAPEKFTGSKLIPVSAPNGKISVESLATHLNLMGVEHKVQPKVLSLTQTTEFGTVYSVAEIAALSKFAHDQGWVVHMDGARVSNAAVALGLEFRAFTRDAGVDILSFGGTKIGMMFGEAVVFLNPSLAKNFKFIRKQAMQLPSKMRFVSAQFNALFEQDLWKTNATHANAMAKNLAQKLRDIPEVRVTQTVEANGIFAILPGKAIEKLRKEHTFHIWDRAKNEVRWMTSFDTTLEDIDTFVSAIRLALVG